MSKFDDIFEKNETIISDIINRLIDCMQIEEICIWGDVKNELKWVYQATRLKRVGCIQECQDYELTYIQTDSRAQLADMLRSIEALRDSQNFVIYLTSRGESDDGEGVESGCRLKTFSALQGELFFAGPIFDSPIEEEIPEDFRALAIIHFYNEADILKKTIEYLLSQDIDIYLVDNWSEDGSYEIAEAAYKEYPERIFLERFPAAGKTEYYEWYNQLERTEQIAKELQYDWFIHYDADEMRVSPWKECTLRQTLYHADRLGYNLIENTVIDHKITETQEDIFMKDTYFDFGHRAAHFRQTKTWKKAEKLDLKKSGGHLAVVDYPKMYPLKILNRHYPLRSVEQAKKKICVDRIPRFQKEKKTRHWHAHYDTFDVERDIIHEKSGLLQWEKKTFDDLYIPLFLGCGVRKIVNDIHFDCEIYKNMRVVLFGAGNWGKQAYLQLIKTAEILLWVDSTSEQYGMIYGMKIQSPEVINGVDTDYAIVAVKNEKVRKEIEEMLLDKGLKTGQIKYIERTD